MDLQEVGRGCGDWMELAQDRDRWWVLVSMVMNFRIALPVIDFKTKLTKWSSKTQHKFCIRTNNFC
jgi:hypothetical protein